MEADQKKLCSICKEDKSENEFIRFSCKHEFCRKCIKKAWKSLIKKESSPSFKCLVEECGRKASIFNIEEVLSSERSLAKLHRKNCDICNKEIIPLKLSCSHEICFHCQTSIIKASLKTNKNAVCPEKTCQQNLNINNLYELGLGSKYIKLFEEGMQQSKIADELLQKDKNNEILEKGEKNAQNENEICQKGMKASKINNEMVQCPICLVPKEKKEFTNLTCSHQFCTDCLLNYFKAKILTNQSDLICPNDACKKEINFYFLKASLPPELFEKYETLLLTQSIYKNRNQNNEKAINCPECQTTFFIWSGAIYFTCSFCKKVFCSHEDCLGLWEKHKDRTCQEYRNLKKDKGEEEFQKMIREKKWASCPKCASIIEKTKGCNHIKCESLKCQKKTIFCYLCSSVLTPEKIKEHYINDNDFGLCKGLQEKEEVENKDVKKNEEEAKYEKIQMDKLKFLQDLSLKCLCENSDINDFEIEEGKYICKKCKNVFCRTCNYNFEDKSEENITGHINNCLPKLKYLSKIFNSRQNCSNCGKKTFKLTNFFFFCDNCFVEVCCLKCHEQIKKLTDYQNHQNCFRNWSSTEYYEEKKINIDDNLRNLQSRFECPICSNKDKANYLEEEGYFICRSCADRIYCKKCLKKVEENDKTEHFLHCIKK